VIEGCDALHEVDEVADVHGGSVGEALREAEEAS
jgi:hypothetical protein